MISAVGLVALDKAQEFQTHTLFELFCMHLAEKQLARDKKHKKERMSSHSFGILMLLQFVCV